MSREQGTLLAGRHIDLFVLPLSFEEFLYFQDVSATSKTNIIKNEIAIKSKLRNYLEYGGFPEVVLRDNKNEILLTYFQDVLEKDLIRRYRIRKGERFKELVRFYLSNVSSLITFSSLGKHLAISADTIEKFSQATTDSFLLFFLNRFSFKVREQEKSPRQGICN